MKSANDIAGWVIRYTADDLGAPVDPMSLEKLIYYAQAFHLVLKDEPLFPDEIHAWRWGPVVKPVYKNYSAYGSNPIDVPFGTVVSLGKELEKFLADLVGFFCRHTAANLSRATHLENPWIDASGSTDDTISQPSLKSFYRVLMEDGEKAPSRSELLDSAPEPRWSSFYVAGICSRKMNQHPFYDGVLAKQLARPSIPRPVLPESFYAPVRGREFVEFTSDEDLDETIRRAHPPRIYKRSGVNPSYPPYEDLELYHHHLHRDGDPLLVTQKVDGDIYGIALATHETYFREDNMQWLKDNAEAIDWSSCPLLYHEVMSYDPFGPAPAVRNDEPDESDSSDDIPF